MGANTSLIVKLVFLLCAGTGWYDGIAAHYSPNLFGRVAVYRGLPAMDCYLSSDWHAVGEYVIVYGVNTSRSVVCLVGDTSQPRDRARHMRAHLFELSYEAALALCGSVKLRNDECPIKVSR